MKVALKLPIGYRVVDVTLPWVYKMPVLRANAQLHLLGSHMLAVDSRTDLSTEWAVAEFFMDAMRPSVLIDGMRLRVLESRAPLRMGVDRFGFFTVMIM